MAGSTSSTASTTDQSRATDTTGAVASTDTSRSTSGQTATGTTSATGAVDSTTSRSATEIASASATSDVSTRITEWRLSPAEIQADIDRGVAIVRTKDSVVGAPTGATDDDVIETMIKGKLQADNETAKAMIEVDANNGEVTLKGSADSASQVGRAIALSLDTQGVTKVSSEVKVKAQSNK